MAARKKKAKKITLSELSFMLEHVVNSVANIEEKVDSSTALTHAPLPSKAVDGINRRLDTEFDATHRSETARPRV
jgi:hypothetical protein